MNIAYVYLCTHIHSSLYSAVTLRLCRLVISRCLSKYARVVKQIAFYIPMYDFAKTTLDDHGGAVNFFLLFNSAAPLIDTTKLQLESSIAKHQINMLVNACCANDELKFVHGGSINITKRLLVRTTYSPPLTEVLCS